MHKGQPICRECLFKNIEYKSRLTIENTMKVKQTASILLCFSGGLNSICLANIMSNLRKRYQKNKLFGELRCIHIQQQNNIEESYAAKFENFTGIKL